MKTVYLLIGVIMVISACEAGEKQGTESGDPVIPDHIAQLDNLTIISPNTVPVDTVELVQEVVFESNEEVFIAGYISKLDIDDSNTVYIGVIPYDSSSPTGIYAFNPDGSFRANVGRAGLGPGEYLTVSMALGNDRLYNYDIRSQKIVSYSLDDYTLANEILIRKDLLPEEEVLARSSTGRAIWVSDSGQIAMSFQTLAISPETDIDKIHFFNISDDGMVGPERLLELDRFSFTFPDLNGQYFLPVVYPFDRSSLIEMDSNGDFYTVWTEDFLIKIYDASGRYQRAIYLPIERSLLNRDNLDLNEGAVALLDEAVIPTDWPAVHAMELDDEDRLWVATITDSDTTFTWYVIDSSGELVARFQMPGAKTYREVMTSPWAIKVRNNYLYTRKQDIRAGIDRIIKHRIEFRHLGTTP